jgi:DNA-binding response OmpR family regulator
MRVLIADKDLVFINLLKEKLNGFGYEVDSATNGLDAKDLFLEKTYEVVILKANLNAIDGISLTKYIKNLKGGVFVYIKGEQYDSILESYCYKSGANDYILDDVNVDNLSLKIKNLFDLHNKHLIKVGPLEINIDSRELYIDGTKKEVTLKEFELLVYLIKNKGKAVSREQIFKDVWGYENFSTDDRTIDTHIKMLRNELSEYKNFIETYRGFGYKFEVK